MLALLTTLFSASTALVSALDARNAPSNVPSGPVFIHAMQRDHLCLGLKSPEAKPGTLVGVVYCDLINNPANGNILTWQFTQPSADNGGAIKLKDTELCLDAGDQSNGIPISVQQCVENNAAQTIAYNSKTQLTVGVNQTCFDVEKDAAVGLDYWYPTIKNLQVWECVTGNVEQVFTIKEATSTWTNPSPSQASASANNVASQPSGSPAAKRRRGQSTHL